MGPLIAVLILAGAAALATHSGPSPNARAHATAASRVAADPVFDAVERDFESRQAELGLVGSAPLFGAEGLPKPTR